MSKHKDNCLKTTVWLGKDYRLTWTNKLVILWTLKRQAKIFLHKKITVWLDKAKPCKWMWKAYRWCFSGSYDNFLLAFLRNLSNFQCMSSKKEVFVTLGHNDLQDLTADILTKRYKDVKIEPKLLLVKRETFYRIEQEIYITR